MPFEGRVPPRTCARYAKPVGRYYPKSGDELRVVACSSEKCRSGDAARRNRLAVGVRHLSGVGGRALERADTRLVSSERWVMPAIADTTRFAFATTHTHRMHIDLLATHEQTTEVDLPQMIIGHGRSSSSLHAAGISAACARRVSVRQWTRQAATRGCARLFDQAHEGVFEPDARRLSFQILCPQVCIEGGLGLADLRTLEPVLHERVRECPLLRMPLAAPSKNFRFRSAKTVRISPSHIRS